MVIWGVTWKPDCGLITTSHLRYDFFDVLNLKQTYWLQGLNNFHGQVLCCFSNIIRGNSRSQLQVELLEAALPFSHYQCFVNHGKEKYLPSLRTKAHDCISFSLISSRLWDSNLYVTPNGSLYPKNVLSSLHTLLIHHSVIKSDLVVITFWLIVRRINLLL